MRLLGLAQADPRVPTSGPGASAKYLFDALARRHEMVDRAGVDLTRGQRYLIAAATFHPNRDRWRARLYWGGRLALKARTHNSRRAVRRTKQPFDLAVQVFGLFHTQDAPFVLYVDNTVHLSRRHWPEWVDIQGRALDRLYAWERDLYSDALHIFTLATPAARSLIDFYGVPEDRVAVVGAGASFDELPEPRREAREPVVIYVGSDWLRKGGDVLVDAFRRVRAAHPEARLQLIGTEEPAPEDGIEVLGFVRDRERLADLYARASVFCLPSRFEPYGLAAVEAMAHELPCVVTPGAPAEIVEDGETGIVVPHEDPVALAGALSRLLEDAPYARRLGTSGRSRVEDHLTWDAVVERMTPGLQQAAGQPRPRRPTRRFRRRSAERAASS